MVLHRGKQRQSGLSSGAAAASSTNGSARAETGSTRYTFVFTDGSADKLVIEKEVVYVSCVTGDSPLQCFPV